MMIFIDLFLRGMIYLRTLNPLAHDRVKSDIVIGENPILADEDGRRDFEFVEPQSDFLEFIACVVGLVLIESVARVHLIPIFKRVFDEPLSIVDEDPVPCMVADGRLFKPPRGEAHIVAILKKMLETVGGDF